MSTFTVRGVEYSYDIYGGLISFIRAGNDPHGEYVALHSSLGPPAGTPVEPLLGGFTDRVVGEGKVRWQGMTLETCNTHIELAYPNNGSVKPQVQFLRSKQPSTFKTSTKEELQKDLPPKELEPFKRYEYKIVSRCRNLELVHLYPDVEGRLTDLGSRGFDIIDIDEDNYTMKREYFE